MAKDNSYEKTPSVAIGWVNLIEKQQGIFYMHHPTDRTVHTAAFVIPVVQQFQQQKIEPLL